MFGLPLQANEGDTLRRRNGVFVPEVLSGVGSLLALFDWSNPIKVTGGPIIATPGRVHLCTGTTTNYTLSLPDPAGYIGQSMAFVMDNNTSTGLNRLVTLYCNVNYGIDNSFYRIMWPGETAILYSIGLSWTKIGGKSIPMAASLKRTTAQSVSSNTWTQIVCSTSIVDNTSALAVPCSDTINGRFNVFRGGNYVLSAFSSIAGAANNSAFWVAAVKNAATPVANPNGNNRMYIFSADCEGNASTTFNCAAGDWIGVSQFCSDGVARNTAISTDRQPTLSATEVPSW